MLSVLISTHKYNSIIHLGSRLLDSTQQPQSHTAHERELLETTVCRIRAAVPVPVFANGGISSMSDLHRCLEYTGTAGVMVSEAALGNPGFFSCNVRPDKPDVTATPSDLCVEYLEMAQRYTPPRYAPGCVRSHIFKIMYTGLTRCEDLRPALAAAQQVEDIIAVSAAV
jgi:tRNA-dihydrouridine synthase